MFRKNDPQKNSLTKMRLTKNPKKNETHKNPQKQSHKNDPQRIHKNETHKNP